MPTTTQIDAIDALMDIIQGCDMILPYTGGGAFEQFAREVKRVAQQGLPKVEVAA